MSDLDERIGQMSAILQTMQKTLQCTICLDMLTKPMKTKCGHSFCGKCLTQLLAGTRGSTQCPLCLAVITKRSLDADQKVSKFVTAVREVIVSIMSDCGLESSPSKYRSKPTIFTDPKDDDSENEENDEPRRGTRNRSPANYQPIDYVLPDTRTRGRSGKKCPSKSTISEDKSSSSCQSVPSKIDGKSKDKIVTPMKPKKLNNKIDEKSTNRIESNAPIKPVTNNRTLLPVSASATRGRKPNKQNSIKNSYKNCRTNSVKNDNTSKDAKTDYSSLSFPPSRKLPGTDKSKETTNMVESWLNSNMATSFNIGVSQESSTTDTEINCQNMETKKSLSLNNVSKKNQLGTDLIKSSIPTFKSKSRLSVKPTTTQSHPNLEHETLNDPEREKLDDDDDGGISCSNASTVLFDPTCSTTEVPSTITAKQNYSRRKRGRGKSLNASSKIKKPVELLTQEDFARVISFSNDKQEKPKTTSKCVETVPADCHDDTPQEVTGNETVFFDAEKKVDTISGKKKTPIDKLENSNSDDKSSSVMLPPKAKVTRHNLSINNTLETSSSKSGSKIGHNTRYASQYRQKLLDNTKIKADTVDINSKKSPGWSHIEVAKKDMAAKYQSLHIVGGGQVSVSDIQSDHLYLNKSNIPSSEESVMDIIDGTQEKLDVEALDNPQEIREKANKLNRIVSSLCKPNTNKDNLIKDIDQLDSNSVVLLEDKSIQDDIEKTSKDVTLQPPLNEDDTILQEQNIHKKQKLNETKSKPILSEVSNVSVVAKSTNIELNCDTKAAENCKKSNGEITDANHNLQIKENKRQSFSLTTTPDDIIILNTTKCLPSTNDSEEIIQPSIPPQKEKFHSLTKAKKILVPTSKSSAKLLFDNKQTNKSTAGEKSNQPTVTIELEDSERNRKIGLDTESTTSDIERKTSPVVFKRLGLLQPNKNEETCVHSVPCDIHQAMAMLVAYFSDNNRCCENLSNRISSLNNINKPTSADKGVQTSSTDVDIQTTNNCINIRPNDLEIDEIEVSECIEQTDKSEFNSDTAIPLPSHPSKIKWKTKQKLKQPQSEIQSKSTVINQDIDSIEICNNKHSSSNTVSNKSKTSDAFIKKMKDSAGVSKYKLRSNIAKVEEEVDLFLSQEACLDKSQLPGTLPNLFSNCNKEKDLLNANDVVNVEECFLLESPLLNSENMRTNVLANLSPPLIENQNKGESSSNDITTEALKLKSSTKSSDNFSNNDSVELSKSKKETSDKRKFKRIRRNSSSDSDSDVDVNPNKKLKCNISNDDSIMSLPSLKPPVNPEYKLDSQELRDMERFDQKIWDQFGRPNVEESFKKFVNKDDLKGLENVVDLKSIVIDDNLNDTNDVIKNLNADLDLINSMRKGSNSALTNNKEEDTIVLSDDCSDHTSGSRIAIKKLLPLKKTPQKGDVHSEIDGNIPFVQDTEDLELMDADEETEIVDEGDNLSHCSVISSQSEVSTQRHEQIKDEVQSLQAKIKLLEAQIGNKQQKSKNKKTETQESINGEQKPESIASVGSNNSASHNKQVINESSTLQGADNIPGKDEVTETKTIKDNTDTELSDTELLELPSSIPDVTTSFISNVPFQGSGRKIRSSLIGKKKSPEVPKEKPSSISSTSTVKSSNNKNMDASTSSTTPSNSIGNKLSSPPSVKKGTNNNIITSHYKLPTHAIVCTGLNAEEIKCTKHMIASLGMQDWCFKQAWSSQVTHVIVKTEPDLLSNRTLKYLYGVANKCWILTYCWILDCLSAKKILSETDYEVLDCTGTPGPFYARRSSRHLFGNWKFYLYPPFVDVTADQLEYLITRSGGSIASSISDLSKYNNEFKKIILIATDTEEDIKELLSTSGVIVVMHDWLIECIGMYSHICITPYICGDPTEDHYKASGISDALLLETQDFV